MPTRRRLKCVLTCGLVLLPAVAVAQSVPPAPADGACYEMFAAEINTLPGSPMLINKCTGQTYVLTRAPAKKAAGGPTYRWLPIAMDDAPAVKAQPATAAPANRNCFTFDGRQFCP